MCIFLIKMSEDLLHRLVGSELHSPNCRGSKHTHSLFSAIWLVILKVRICCTKTFTVPLAPVSMFNIFLKKVDKCFANRGISYIAHHAFAKQQMHPSILTKCIKTPRNMVYKKLIREKSQIDLFFHFITA